METSVKNSVESTFTVVGTVQDYCGAKGRIDITKRSLLNTDVRVTVRMYNEAGELKKVLLSEYLSQELRANRVRVGNLPPMDYGYNEKGHWYIQQPEGQVFSFNMEDLDIEEIVAEEVDVNEIITL